MISPYTIRLLLLCLASFVVLHEVLSIPVALAASTILRYADTFKSRAATHFLFAMRIAPAVLSVLLILGFCVPSYLRFEPSASAERTGLKCLLLAALGVGVFGRGIVRAAAGLLHSFRFTRNFRQHGREMEFTGGRESSPILSLVVDHPAPVIAVAGIFRQVIIVSRVLLDSLSPEEFDAVLQHEKAHRFSFDNLKHLLLLFAPEPCFLFKSARTMQAHWARFTERAADDHAAGGDPLRAVSLAAALLCCARMGETQKVPDLVSPLFCDSGELSIRVERLLRIEPPPAIPARNLPGVAVNGCIALCMILAAGLLSPALFPAVHECLEYLIR